MVLIEAVRNALSGLLPAHMVDSLAPKVAKRLREQLRDDARKRLEQGRSDGY
jgi:hypothetical protein